jgi:glycerol-3-phosphate O-acyltransferase
MNLKLSILAVSIFLSTNAFSFLLKPVVNTPNLSSTRLLVTKETVTESILAPDLQKCSEMIWEQMSSTKEYPESFVKMLPIFKDFLKDYTSSCSEADISSEKYMSLISTFMSQLAKCMVDPPKFQVYHEAVEEMYKWGNDFMRPLVKMDESFMLGTDLLPEIKAKIENGENVFFLANHQTEADPQVISLLFEKEGYPDLARKVICVAGHKVTTDPLCIPFSMGRNLVCIHSKKHMNNPPELKKMKQEANQKSMTFLSSLLTKGGNIVWVAPSGGRDRKDATGKVPLSPVDPKSVEMFRVLAKLSRRENSFYAMSMRTFELFPAPETLSSDIGETRSAKRAAVSLKISELGNWQTQSKKEFCEGVVETTQQGYDELERRHGQLS